MIQLKIREKNGKFYYDIPVAGTETCVSLRKDDSDLNIVAMIHTHGGYFESYKNSEGATISRALEFSDTDLLLFRETKMISYVVVPSGELFVVDDYNPKDGYIIGVFKPVYPSDPLCPCRKNTLDASLFPDNYFKR